MRKHARRDAATVRMRANCLRRTTAEVLAQRAHHAPSVKFANWAHAALLETAEEADKLREVVMPQVAALRQAAAAEVRALAAAAQPLAAAAQPLAAAAQPLAAAAQPLAAAAQRLAGAALPLAAVAQRAAAVQRLAAVLRLAVAALQLAVAAQPLAAVPLAPATQQRVVDAVLATSASRESVSVPVVRVARFVTFVTAVKCVWAARA
jgi:hypothetical protein